MSRVLRNMYCTMSTQCIHKASQVLYFQLKYIVLYCTAAFLPPFIFENPREQSWQTWLALNTIRGFRRQYCSRYTLTLTNKLSFYIFFLLFLRSEISLKVRFMSYNWQIKLHVLYSKGSPAPLFITALKGTKSLFAEQKGSSSACKSKIRKNKDVLRAVIW